MPPLQPFRSDQPPPSDDPMPPQDYNSLPPQPYNQPPPPPNQPYQPAPLPAAYDFANVPPPEPRPNRVGPIVGILIVLLPLVGAGLFVYVRQRPTPDGVFKAAVQNSLSTQQVKQVTTAGPSNQEFLYDFSRTRDPRLYTHAKSSQAELPIDLEQYTSLKNTFVKYHQFAELFNEGGKYTKYKDKWLQERKNGADTTNGGALESLFVPEAYDYFFGDWIFGNFPSGDATGLTDYIVGQKVYAYDAAKVTKQKLSGQDVSVYKVTEDATKKLTMNKKAAALLGMDGAKLEEDLRHGAAADSATLYVNIKTKRLVQVDAEAMGEKAITKYTDYDTAQVPAQPVIEAYYPDFLGTN